jgi:cysteinyl-tRNA synthetase
LDSVRATVDYNEPLATEISSMKLSIEKEMENDLNVSGALGAIFEAIKEINKALDANTVGEHQAKEILNRFFEVEKIFGFFPKEEVFKQEELPQEILDILEERRVAREEKNWAKSDELRDLLKEKGYLVVDSKNGQECKKV